MHCIVGAFIFTNHDLISARYSSFENLKMGRSTLSEVLQDGIFDRFAYGVGILYFLFIFIVVLQYVFREQIMKVLAIVLPRVYKYCCKCVHGRVEKWLEKYGQKEDLSIKSRDIFSDLRIDALHESYLRAKMDIKEAPESIKEAIQMRID
jgi:hypothetical protein